MQWDNLWERQGEPKATSKTRPKAKNPRGRRPQGFLAFGLFEDVVKGLHLENPEGGLQYSFEGVCWVLKGHNTPVY